MPNTENNVQSVIGIPWLFVAGREEERKGGREEERKAGREEKELYFT